MRLLMPITSATALLAAFAPLPALAEESPDSGLSAAVEEMRDPARQEQMAGLAKAMMGAMLQVKVGPLLGAMAEITGEDAGAIDEEATLADIAGPEAQEAPARFAAAMPAMMDAMGTLAGTFEAMLPELRRVGETMAEKFPEGADIDGE